MINDYAPMNSAEVLDRAVDVYKKSFWKQVAFSTIAGIISVVFSLTAGTVWSLSVGSFLSAITPTGGSGYFFIIISVYFL